VGIGVLSIAVAGLLALGLGIYFFYHDQGFATELRQVRQPRPTHFTIGVDVSQTVGPELLASFKAVTLQQLRELVGDPLYHYQVSVFGLPGCGKEAVADILKTQSPEDPVAFTWQVEEKINKIDIAYSDGSPSVKEALTTPLYFFLDQLLRDKIGQRIIIFSDLVNDDTGCANKNTFPRDALVQFGASKSGQVLFFYPTPELIGPHRTHKKNEELRQEQDDFIERVLALRRAGKVRAYFYHVPSDALERQRFLRLQFENAIPDTNFRVLWERVTKIVDSYVHGFRG
jgi:hypothetical protein